LVPWKSVYAYPVCGAAHDSEWQFVQTAVVAVPFAWQAAQLDPGPLWLGRASADVMWSAAASAPWQPAYTQGCVLTVCEAVPLGCTSAAFEWQAMQSRVAVTPLLWQSAHPSPGAWINAASAEEWHFELMHGPAGTVCFEPMAAAWTDVTSPGWQAVHVSDAVTPVA
jgi:hypothetical protein